jgi:hypothetical protein
VKPVMLFGGGVGCINSVRGAPGRRSSLESVTPVH